MGRATITCFVMFVLLFLVGYLSSQKPKISIDNECAKFMLLKGRYRSWSICYSDGLRLNPDGTTTNLWRWPTFHHVDVRDVAPPRRVDP
jgi:hypothetical protein